MENDNKSAMQMEQLLDPKNQDKIIPMFIAMGMKEMVEQGLDKVDLNVLGPSYLAVSNFSPKPKP
jgi:hypothetical protein